MIWLTPEIYTLAVTAMAIGILHTAIGPDHYLPFVVLSKARQWSARRTLVITAACGMIHVAGSVILGLAGVAFGLALQQLEWVEGVRGDLAAWALLSVGLVYMLWGLRRAYKNRPHSHWHVHADGSAHEHIHTHHNEHAHIHEQQAGFSLTPWALFLVFAFGPCEALIPVLMYPAAANNVPGLIFVTSVFAITTIVTMLMLVMVARWGLGRLQIGDAIQKRLQRYAHALAGGAISLCAGMMLAGF
ncbi:MAG: sulfite exporter TauE/SafE family protein [Pseudomonadota bacterium]